MIEVSEFGQTTLGEPLLDALRDWYELSGDVDGTRVTEAREIPSGKTSRCVTL